MTAWLAAAAAGLLLAALSYVARLAPSPAVRAALAALRALAVTLLAALALDAPAGRTRALPAMVGIDVSASWGRGARDLAAFRSARDAARSRAGDTLWALGDSLRPASGDSAADLTSRVGALADRAAAAGRALVLYTDGEIDDAASLRSVPRGSRVELAGPRRGRDLAALSIDLPRLAAATDTIDVRVTLAADASGAGAGTLRVQAGAGAVVESRVDSVPAFAERTVAARLPLRGLAGQTIVRAVVASAGDTEARNDTIATTLDVSAAPAAVFVSSAPDYDARAVLAVLRGALALPTRAYLRVAPGQWRVEGTLAPATEGDVRQAAAAAGVLVLHGDTALLGAPRAIGRGALLLFPTSAPAPPGARDEWYASDAPPSPASAALSGIAWDSLPPLDLAGAAPTGEFEMLRARLGRAGAPRAAVAGSERPRRVVVVGATGFWRWQFRGGAAADAFTGLWGGVFDFLAAGRGDARAAVVADAVLRAGEPLRWRRGGADSVVVAVVRRRGGATVDTARLRFGARGDPATSAPLSAGVYDVDVPGGTSVLAVNVARELLPRRPSVTAGPIGTAPAADATPRVRSMGWLYGLVLVLLCAEWMLRRRVGLR